MKRALRYLEQFMSDGYTMTGKDISLYLTIIKLYEQQYMYENDRVNLLSVGESQKIPCYELAQIVFS